MKPRRRYPAYIFDFDMTLADSLGGARKAYRRAMEAVGLKFEDAMAPTFVRESLDHTMDRFSLSPCARREFIAAFILESHNSMGANTRLFPETEEVIRTLRGSGARLSIASGKRADMIKEILDRHGLTRMFDVIVGYGDAPRPKPAPDQLLKCMSFYDLPPGDFCYVGDSPHDMQAADAAGIDGICVVRGVQPGSACRGDISDLRQLLV
ncbi:MAG: HAD-IA family hydrolase [Thermoplasmatales archaeon]|nr:HAD-IA family hydrolase [Thermoplasmatales archaeon]